MAEDIATRLKRARKRLGMTQAQFARALDVSQRTVEAWEGGRSEPRRQRLAKLQALGFRAAWLIGGEGEMLAPRAQLQQQSSQTQEIGTPEQPVLPTTRSQIVERIKVARRALGMTQAQLAQVFGVSRRTVESWEGGENEPRRSRLVKLQALGFRAAWLIDGEGDMLEPGAQLQQQDAPELPTLFSEESCPSPLEPLDDDASGAEPPRKSAGEIDGFLMRRVTAAIDLVYRQKTGKRFDRDAMLFEAVERYNYVLSIATGPEGYETAINAMKMKLAEEIDARAAADAAASSGKQASSA